MFETELLRSFVAVAELQGFTRAAEHLHLTQSTVSAQIRRLEDQAGRPLLRRSTRSVALTEAGETLLGYARSILRLNQDARASLSASSLAGGIRIGASEDVAGSGLPEVLRRFAARHPAVRIEVEVGIATTLFQALEGGRLDLILCSRCHGDGRGWILLARAAGLGGRRRHGRPAQPDPPRLLPRALPVPRGGAGGACREPASLGASPMLAPASPASAPRPWPGWR